MQKIIIDMKVLQSSFFRAIIAIIVGTLLIRYREETATWLTILIGVLFFLSGVISCTVYYSQKKRAGDTVVYDAQGNQLTGLRPNFPIVGLGSLILGVILALMPGTFLYGLMYILAAILILGAINQFVNLSLAHKIGHVGAGYWIMPSLLLLAGLVVIVKRIDPISTMLFIIGWCMLIYGIVECVNAIKIHNERRKYEASPDPSEGGECLTGESSESSASEE